MRKIFHRWFDVLYIWPFLQSVRYKKLNVTDIKQIIFFIQNKMSYNFLVKIKKCLLNLVRNNNNNNILTNNHSNHFLTFSHGSAKSCTTRTKLPTRTKLHAHEKYISKIVTRWWTTISFLSWKKQILYMVKLYFKLFSIYWAACIVKYIQDDWVLHLYFLELDFSKV